MGRFRRWRETVGLREWWQTREASSAELASLLSDLGRSPASPDACAALLGRLAEFDPLFEDCPDPGLDELNRLRRAALRRALHAGATGDGDRAADHLDEFNALTAAAIDRLTRASS